MKYLLLPLHLLTFWYQESWVFWFRVWRNTIWYLEEDLAVLLMFRLLFVPLFHDSTIVGRALSLVFRLSRIFIGLFAFSLFSILEFWLAIYWFLVPFISFLLPKNIFPSDFSLLTYHISSTEFLGVFNLLSKVILFSGLALFTGHIVSHPEKKLGQVKDVRDIWSASFVGKNSLSFNSLLSTSSVKNLLVYLEADLASFQALPDSLIASNLAEAVWQIGQSLNLQYLYPEHFFVAKLSLTPGIDKFLAKPGLSLNDFKTALDFLEKKRQLNRLGWVWEDDFHIRHLKGINRGWLGVPTPALDAVSQDLTQKATKQQIENYVGREETLTQVVNILSSEKDANVMIVGEPGAGKSALVDYLAKLIVSGDAPQALATKRLVAIDFAKLLTGVQTQGDLAQKVKDIFDEVKFSANIIIFVDEIENLGLAQVFSDFNLFALMLPYLESSDFQFIATTEASNYSQVIEKNGSFARIFNKVELSPASVDETLSIIKSRAIEAEWKGAKTTVLAMQEMVKLASLYLHDKVLPDSALTVFNQCLVQGHGGWINKALVEKVVTEDTKVPVGDADSKRKVELLNLESIIHKRLIDQQEAVLAVANALRRSAANLSDQDRPIGSFLFVGPTGVGKTELAKILADVYFQGGGQFLRFDMSEYQTEESVAKLIGKTDQEGQLTEAVRHNPYALILLDEFEKANSKVLTIFSQVLEDGRLTDGLGKTVDFKSTIIIATSNAGSLNLAMGLKSGKSLSDLEPEIEKELMQIFRPELVNRFDETILFKPLSQVDLQKIVQLKLASLQKKLEAQGYLVGFSSDLVSQLTTRGYNPVLGARPLRRLIQDTLEASLSVLILEGKLSKGETYELGSSMISL